MNKPSFQAFSNKVMTTSSAGGLRISLRDSFLPSPKGEV